MKYGKTLIQIVYVVIKKQLLKCFSLLYVFLIDKYDTKDKKTSDSEVFLDHDLEFD